MPYTGCAKRDLVAMLLQYMGFGQDGIVSLQQLGMASRGQALHNAIARSGEICIAFNLGCYRTDGDRSLQHKG